VIAHTINQMANHTGHHKAQADKKYHIIIAASATNDAAPIHNCACALSFNISHLISLIFFTVLASSISLK
jgi:hypothetical protein